MTNKEIIEKILSKSFLKVDKNLSNDRITSILDFFKSNGIIVIRQSKTDLYSNGYYSSHNTFFAVSREYNAGRKSIYTSGCYQSKDVLSSYEGNKYILLIEDIDMLESFNEEEKDLSEIINLIKRAKKRLDYFALTDTVI